jgi:hypothetical protein
MKLTLKDNYYKAQLHLLERVEGKHHREPQVQDAAVAVTATAIEMLVAFGVLFPAGWLIAIIGAVFPAILIWGAAVYGAEREYLPEKCAELIEQYEDELEG